MTGPTKKPKARKKAHSPKVVPTAIHAAHRDGVRHVVGLNDIRVVIVPDGNKFWFAQGLDIDYAAQGTSIEDVKSNFEKGLTATIEQHLQMYGSLKKLLQVAPAEVCQDLLLDSSAEFKRFSLVSAHEIHEAIPYQNIKYLVAAAECE